MGSRFKKKRNKDINNKPGPKEEPYQPEWMKYAIPVTRVDTSGRITLLFYGPCYSGKSRLFKYIKDLPNFESKGAMIGVAYCKRPEKIKDKEVFVDSYDIKKFFIEKCNLFIIIFDPTKDNCIQEIEDCINNIKTRENKDPYKFILCSTKINK